MLCFIFLYYFRMRTAHHASSPICGLFSVGFSSGGGNGTNGSYDISLSLRSTSCSPISFLFNSLTSSFRISPVSRDSLRPSSSLRFSSSFDKSSLLMWIGLFVLSSRHVSSESRPESSPFFWHVHQGLLPSSFGYHS